MTLSNLAKLQSYIAQLLGSIDGTAIMAAKICNFCDELMRTEEEKKRKLLLVEDGSIDFDNEIEDLKKMNIKVLVYRQGANKPELINKGDKE